MAKYNVVKKAKRAEIQERKRAVHGDRASGKLSHKQPNSVPISGKRKRKLFKKWRREQKEALQKGVVTMEDVEMAVAEGSSRATSIKSQRKFPLKKGRKLRIKDLKGKGKRRIAHTKPGVTVAPVDAMQE